MQPLQKSLRNRGGAAFTCMGRRRKWQRMGQQVRKYKNLLNKEFPADRPIYKKDVLYPSMIRDLYDNIIVACKTGTEQTVNLVLDIIHLAMHREKKRDAACATPLRLTLHISLHRGLFVLSVRSGAVHITCGLFCMDLKKRSCICSQWILLLSVMYV